jgi:hypothetical protein
MTALFGIAANAKETALWYTVAGWDRSRVIVSSRKNSQKERYRISNCEMRVMNTRDQKSKRRKIFRRIISRDKSVEDAGVVFVEMYTSLNQKNDGRDIK